MMQVGDLKMIELSTNYKITLSEEQARRLHQLLLDTKDLGNLKYGGLYVELRPLYEELRAHFNTGLG